MDYEFEEIVYLTRRISEKCKNVSKYTVRKIGTKYFVKMLNSKKEIVFGMQGDYNGIVKLYRLILEK